MDNGNGPPALTPNSEFSDENRKSLNSGLIYSYTRLNIHIFRYIVIIAVPIHFSLFYQVKSILRCTWVLRHVNFGCHFLGQSLLMSTIVLKDNTYSVV